LPNIAGHLSDQQTHRNVGEREGDQQCDEERGDESSEGQDRRHLRLLDSKRPAEKTGDPPHWKAIAGAAALHTIGSMDFIHMLPISARAREPLKAALRGEGAVWPELSDEEIRALRDHGVAPLVYAAARVPQLRNDAIRAAAIEPLRAEDLREVLAALRSRGIDVLLMKGSALAYEIYAAPEQRPRGDTDLLIAESSIDRVREAFAALGFNEAVTSGDEHGIRQTTFTRAGAFGLEHAYDVHWAIANTPLFASVLRFEDLLTSAVAIPRLDEDARGLRRIDALLLACIHRVAHHHDSDRLIWLVDIALLRDAMSEKEHRAFWRIAADAKVVGVCSRSIELADEWMSRAPRHRAEQYLSREELERDEPSRAFLDHDMTYGGVMLTNLRALPWRARLRRLRQLAFPPAEFMHQSFPSHSRLALPWLYVYRGARGIMRLFRRVGA